MANISYETNIFQLKVVYKDDDDDDDGDNKPSEITKHIGQPRNEYARPISTMDVFPMLWKY